MTVYNTNESALRRGLVGNSAAVAGGDSVQLGRWQRQGPFGGRANRCPDPLPSFTMDKVMPQDHEPSVSSISRGTLRSALGKSDSAQASRYFYVDKEGNFVDAALESRGMFPTFHSQHLETQYVQEATVHWRAGVALPTSIGMALAVVSSGVVDAVMHDTPLWTRVVRVVAAAVAVFIGVNIIRRRLHCTVTKMTVAQTVLTVAAVRSLGPVLVWLCTP